MKSIFILFWLNRFAISWLLLPKLCKVSQSSLFKFHCCYIFATVWVTKIHFEIHFSFLSLPNLELTSMPYHCFGNFSSVFCSLFFYSANIKSIRIKPVKEFSISLCTDACTEFSISNNFSRFVSRGTITANE